MRRLRGVFVKVAAVIFPWAPRHERRAAIAAATQERERSRAGKEHAKSVEREITRMWHENHWAARIADQVRRGYQP